jgi:hypothetical protein
MSVSKQLLPLTKKTTKQVVDPILDPNATLEDLLEAYCTYRNIQLVRPETPIIYRNNEWRVAQFAQTTAWELYYAKKTTAVKYFAALAKSHLEPLEKQPAALMMRLEQTRVDCNGMTTMPGWQFTLMVSDKSVVVLTGANGGQ